MKERNILIKYSEYADINKMPESDNRLVTNAREAVHRGYAPYSGFRVGAAVLLGNGTIITGNNQENAAYPSGLCAERTALFYASSQYPKVPVIAIAVSTFGNGFSDDAKPCGACRQAISEYEDLAGEPIRIILDGHERITVFESIDCLLPFRFGKRDMGE